MSFFKTLLVGLLTFCATSASALADTADCAHEASLKSPPGVRSSKVSFSNSSKDQRKVYWINGAGKRQFFSIVAPSQTYDVSTFASHIWVVTDGADKCVSVVVASSAPMMVDIGAVKAEPVVAQPVNPAAPVVVPHVATPVWHNPANACSRNQVYSSSMRRCIDKAVTCSKNQVYSSSMGQCITKAVTCSSNQVYSSSLGQCIPKTVTGPSKKVTILHGCPYNLDKVCTKTSSGKLTNCHCAS